MNQKIPITQQWRNVAFSTLKKNANENSRRQSVWTTFSSLHHQNIQRHPLAKRFDPHLGQGDFGNANQLGCANKHLLQFIYAKKIIAQFVTRVYVVMRIKESRGSGLDLCKNILRKNMAMY